MRSKVANSPSEVESRIAHLEIGKLNKLERDDLLHLIVEIQLTILDKLEERKELESSLSKRGMKVTGRPRDIIGAITERGLDCAISEWFGGNPKGKINRESFEQYSDSQAIDNILSRTYFRRKGDFRNLEELKKGNSSLRSHEGIGLDFAAKAIISEHLNLPGQSIESSKFDEQSVIEAIVCFMKDNPAGPASFRRKFRERMALEHNLEKEQSIDFIRKEMLPQKDGEIKELRDFNTKLLRNWEKGHDDVRAVIGVLEFFNRVGREEPTVQNEMLGVWLSKQKNEAIKVSVHEFLGKRKSKVPTIK